MPDLSRLSTDSAHAEHVLAMRSAEGAGVPLDWNKALDHLQCAAEQGLVHAQAELAAMAGDWNLSREIFAGKNVQNSVWKELRQSVGIAKWLTAPAPRILSPSPRIATVDAFAAPEMCDWLVARARPRLAPAKVYDHHTGGPRKESVRTNSECHFLRDESDLVLLAIRARIAMVTELPVLAMEAPAILHYEVGQEFLPHYDFLNTSNPGYAKDVAELGQRVLTFLLCLSDGFEGGETEFPALGKRWKGAKGSALFFWNVEPDGSPDLRTVHAGLAPTQGEKWLLSQWVRGAAVAMR